MEVIEIQCGSCGQVMALSVEHLGSQVRCPHCQAVVQAPAAEVVPDVEPPAEEAAADFELPPFLRSDERESIFTEPDSEDVFDTPTPRPRIEVPADDGAAEDEGGMTATFESGAPAFGPNLALEASRGQSSAAASSRPAPPPLSPHLAGMEGLAAPSLAKVPRRRSLLMPTLLIFLIPYSIVATIFVIILLMQKPPHPLESLPDPDPTPKNKKGSPRKITRVSHDEPLPASLITRLGQPLRIGDIEVTPLDVRLTPGGRLALRLKTKNLSKDHAFVPMSNAFLDFEERDDAARPYTFLHTKNLAVRIYGGFLEHQTEGKEPDLGSEGELLPGQHGVVQLTTLDRFDGAVKKALEAKDPLLWRVQVRRGLVNVRGEQISATAVVGVEFARTQITREKWQPPEDDF